jgi:hypothetical protein
MCTHIGLLLFVYVDDVTYKVIPNIVSWLRDRFSFMDTEN